MGLAEQLRAGGNLERQTTTFTTNAVGSGSVDLNSSYVILSINTNQPCRIRLYENSASRDDSTETSRNFGDTNISGSIALVGDFSMSLAGTYTTDPVLYAVTEANSLTYYRIEPASSQEITISTFTLEDKNVPPTVGTPYTVDNRRTLPDITGSLASGSLITGTLDTTNIPITYLLVSASVTGPSASPNTGVARLRLYHNTSSFSDVGEVSRSFDTEPSESSYLVSDMIISGGSYTYFVPKIVGANLSTITNDLTQMVNNQTLIDANAEIYYILQNMESTATDLTASVHVFSLED